MKTEDLSRAIELSNARSKLQMMITNIARTDIGVIINVGILSISTATYPTLPIRPRAESTLRTLLASTEEELTKLGIEF